MPRKPRVYGESGIYHIIVRGNNQQNLFYDNNDRYFFLSRIKKYSEELKLEIYSYCLMNNHVHILLGKANDTLSKFVQKVTNSFVYYFNKKYERSGHLFQGRFKSEPVDTDEYFKTVIRYILQNPIKAGLKTFELFKWNSYQCLFDLTKKTYINRNFVYEVFSGKNSAQNFIREINNDICMEYRNKYTICDDDAIKVIKKITRIKKISQVFKMNEFEQKEAISKLKVYLSINQISRITGLNKTVIKES